MTPDLFKAVYDNGGLLSVIGFGLAILAYLYLNDVRKTRFKRENDRIELERRKEEIELDKTAQVNRLQNLSIVQKFQLAQERIRELEESKVSKTEYDALALELDDIKKSFVAKSVHEKLQTDYTTMQQTLKQKHVEGDALIKGLQDRIEELNGSIDYYMPLAERTVRSEEAYDRLKVQNDEQARIISQQRVDLDICYGVIHSGDPEWRIIKLPPEDTKDK